MKGKKSGYASDALDETEEDKNKPATKKRKLSKVTLEKLKAKEKAKAKTGRKKKAGNADDDYEDSDEDEYTALSRGGFTRVGKGSVLPPAGSFEDCATCQKRFTVVCLHVALFSNHTHNVTSDSIHNDGQSRTRLPLPQLCQSVRCGSLQKISLAEKAQGSYGEAEGHQF